MNGRESCNGKRVAPRVACAAEEWHGACDTDVEAVRKPLRTWLAGEVYLWPRAPHADNASPEKSVQARPPAKYAWKPANLWDCDGWEMRQPFSDSIFLSATSTVRLTRAEIREREMHQ